MSSNTERTNSYKDIATWAVKSKRPFPSTLNQSKEDDKPPSAVQRTPEPAKRVSPKGPVVHSALTGKPVGHSSPPEEQVSKHWADDKPFPSRVTPVKVPRRNVIPSRAMSFGAAKGDCHSHTLLCALVRCVLCLSLVLLFALARSSSIISAAAPLSCNHGCL